MNTGSRSPRIVWGHLLLLLGIAAVVIAYLLSARARSLNIQNLLLVQPAAIIALLLVLAIVPQCFRRDAAAAVDEGPVVRRAKLIELLKVGAMAAGFGAFAFSLERIGFDIASYFFLAVGLYICGERRWWVLLVYPALFTAVLIWGFRMLIPYPLFTTIL